ncbi:P-loop containing nucleoside triphosphate hydrolase protein [Suillus bovinus]|uniref:P-loop containing nucleoside triphosphate hydrolase protein n=1 Tax=Suillus bovinus TaxID=48563 RepID=UPI001B8775FD|nr:P-loop containing nucleoside triphosphate hydrolase protein [Suillus bovinus]KAG2136580.1 P-loop containing nucleoside triphosphate hydrolase protein [Suillus bovinus]
MSKNVVIIGQSGAGKSSLINMLCPGADARISNDATGCTQEEQEYTCVLGRGKSCQVHDTIGLEEGRWGFLPDKKAQKKLKTYLKDSQKSWHLLVYCIPGSRGLKKSHARNFNKFKSMVGNRVPVVVVVTHLDQYEGPLQDWWPRNLDTLKKLDINPESTAGHACITALSRRDLERYNKGALYNQSLQDVQNLIRSILWPSRANRTTT